MLRMKNFFNPIKRVSLLLRSNRGFTLIEFLVVIVIVGILAGMAMIQVRTAIAQQDLRSSAEKLVSEVRTMQNLSLKKAPSDAAGKVKMTFTTTSYQIITDSATAEGLPIVQLPASVTLPGGLADLTFDPRVFANNTKRMIILSNSSGKRTLVIAPQTGRIRLDSSSNPGYLSNEN